MIRIPQYSFFGSHFNPPINIEKAYYCSWLKNNKFLLSMSCKVRSVFNQKLLLNGQNVY